MATVFRGQAPRRRPFDRTCLKQLIGTVLAGASSRSFRVRYVSAFAIVVLVSLFAPRSAAAQAPEPAASEKADLAKQLSNPLASLVSVPFQFNWEQNV